MVVPRGSSRSSSTGCDLASSIYFLEPNIEYHESVKDAFTLSYTWFLVGYRREGILSIHTRFIVYDVKDIQVMGDPWPNEVGSREEAHAKTAKRNN